MNLDEIARLNRVQTEDLRGPQGPSGADGRDGERGPGGLDGTDGADGRDGKAGERGLKGDQGDKGDPGRDGFDAQGRVAIRATDEPDFLPKKLVAGPNVTITEEGFGSIRWLRVSATAAAPVNYGGGGGGAQGVAGAPGAQGPPGPAGPAGAAGADAPSTLDLHLMGWDGSAWIPVLGDSTGRLVVTS